MWYKVAMVVWYVWWSVGVHEGAMVVSYEWWNIGEV